MATPLRLALFDDDTEFARELAAAYEAVGFVVHVETSSDDAALGRAIGFAPDALSLDVNMPHRNGFALGALLRTNPRTRTTPLVFVTTVGSARARAQAQELGAVGFFVKWQQPPEAIAHAVATLVHEPTAGVVS